MTRINDCLRAVLPDADGIRPPFVCKDGFSFSIRAGAGFMCHPQKDYDFDNGVFPVYHNLELSFDPNDLTAHDKSILGCFNKQTDSIYGYVHVSRVGRLIAAHGGLANNPCGEKLDQSEQITVNQAPIPINTSWFFANTDTGDKTTIKDVAKVWLYIDGVSVDVMSSHGRLATINPICA